MLIVIGDLLYLLYTLHNNNSVSLVRMLQGFQTSMYASPWFLTMFASVLSLNVVFRIMDIFLLEGREILFRIGLALIEHNVDKLMTSDLEEIVKVSCFSFALSNEGSKYI